MARGGGGGGGGGEFGPQPRLSQADRFTCCWLRRLFSINVTLALQALKLLHRHKRVVHIKKIRRQGVLAWMF